MDINHRIGTCATEYLVGRRYDVTDIQCAKVCYAIESLMGTFQKNLILFCFFAISGRILEFLYCFITVNLVRRYLGGMHMKTSMGCTVVSIGVYVLAVAGGSLFPVAWQVWISLFGITGILMMRIAPLPSPTRPRYNKTRKKAIRKRGMCGLLILGVLACIYPACRSYIAWTLVLQIVEVGIVLTGEMYVHLKNMEITVPVNISEEAEKLFMEFTRNYEKRQNGQVQFPKTFRAMTRKDRTMAFSGFTNYEKDEVLNLMTEEQKERLMTDIHCQAVLDFWKR